jgi:leucyl/phenylalanyl-tRNA---protein transferase
MRRDVFPDPATFDYPEYVRFGSGYYSAHGVIAFGIPPTLGNLREAYHKGIFPWPIAGLPLPWHCPDERAIIEFDELHIPRSLAKVRRASTLIFTIDKDFRRVMLECAGMKRPDQPGTWITREFLEVYGRLHDEGVAHSVEAWDEKGDLVGGLYGVDPGGAFCGESMFHKEPNASKLALLFLIDHLKSRGATWLDSQVMTPHMQRLGAKDISRTEFLKKLKETQSRGLTIFPR